jgi:hypothetical protein
MFIDGMARLGAIVGRAGYARNSKQITPARPQFVARVFVAAGL